MLLKTIRFLVKILPARVPEITYAMLLGPRLLRRLAHRVRHGIIDLDHLLAENEIDAIQLIKMEFQGAEGLALRGIVGYACKKFRSCHLYGVWPGGIEEEVESAAGRLRELMRAGFRFKAIDENKRTLTDLPDIEQLIARHDKLQYRSGFPKEPCQPDLYRGRHES